MKPALVLALALVVACPIVTLPSSSGAQVRVGASAPRVQRQPGLSQRDRERLFEAQDDAEESEAAISELTSLTANGGALTEAQARQLADHQRRLASAQERIERLEAKQERLGG